MKTVALAAVAGLVLAGCGGGSTMMGTTSGYHYSTQTCTAPASLPGRTVSVVLADMGMSRMMGGTAPLGSRMLLRASTARVAAGPVTIVATNLGWRTHELVVLPLGAGDPVGARQPAASGKVDEAGSLGEASTSCRSGAGDGIAAGSVGWTTLTLAPGRYELVCNLPNHYADGMRAELLVS